MGLLLAYYYFANLFLDVNEYLNDLWQYNTSSGLWCWIKGSDLPFGTGNYDTRGKATDYTTPGSRHESFYWRDIIGNFYLYGGFGVGMKGKSSISFQV